MISFLSSFPLLSLYPATIALCLSPISQSTELNMGKPNQSGHDMVIILSTFFNSLSLCHYHLFLSPVSHFHPSQSVFCPSARMKSFRTMRLKPTNDKTLTFDQHVSVCGFLNKIPQSKKKPSVSTHAQTCSAVFFHSDDPWEALNERGSIRNPKYMQICTNYMYYANRAPTRRSYSPPPGTEAHMLQPTLLS